MIAPFIIVFNYEIVYTVLKLFGNAPELEPNTITLDSIRADLPFAASAVLCAPVIEELSFRYMALTPFRKKSHRITVMIVVSVIFGVLHIRNWCSVILDALLLGTVFLKARNINYTILIHAFKNLWVMPLTALSLLGVNGIVESVTGSTIIILFPTGIKIAVCISALLGALVMFSKKPKIQKNFV